MEYIYKVNLLRVNTVRVIAVGCTIQQFVPKQSFKVEELYTLLGQECLYIYPSIPPTHKGSSEAK